MIPDGCLDEAQALVVVACGESPTAFVQNDLWAWMEQVCMDPVVRSKPALALLRLLLETDLSFAQISALLLWKCVTRSHECANRPSREAVTVTIIPALGTQ